MLARSTVLCALAGAALSAAQADWSYLCLGMKHGCVLAQHTGTPGVVSGFYTNLTTCEDACPMIGRELSWECTGAGNCEVAAHKPDGVTYFKSVSECSLAPGGKCFAPGSKKISYECHGAHFGCVPKEEEPDEKTKFANVDDCEAKCHVVPPGMSFGCAGSRPTGCVLLAQKADPLAHLFPGIEACNAWCSPP